MAGKKPLLFDHGLQSLLHAKENDLNLFEGPAVPIELASDPVPERMSLSPESGDQTCTVTIDDVEILVSFIHESQDHLSDMEEKILSLESAGDPAVVDEIFRSMHTMKGTSSFFGLDGIRDVSHCLESVLDNLRNSTTRVSAELIDVLLAGTDLLEKMIGNLAARVQQVDTSDVPVEIKYSPLDTVPLLARIAGLAASPAPDIPAEPVRQSPEPPAATDSLITPELTESFAAEARELLDQVEREILVLEKRPDDTGPVDGAFRAVHTVKGNAGFLGLGDIEQRCMELESNLEAIRLGEKKVRPKTITILLNTTDALRQLIGRPDSSSETSVAVIDEDRITPSGDLHKPVGELLIELGETTEEAIESALDQQDRRVGEILVSEGAVSEAALRRALNFQQRAKPDARPDSTESARERKHIRVDMDKLDKLFDLTGELIIAGAMVAHDPSQQTAGSGNRATTHLNKITREMQEITLSVRMIPLEGLFTKMRRLVRDLSKRFSKKVDLIVEGQDTEMDRSVIEQISDPLIHIIRNAVDHGIEEPAPRVQAGKPESGKIRLSARYEGNEIWISIQDDGKGLNRERLLAKAAEKGLLRTDPATMSDSDVWQLAFEPGFSTAERLSEVSGRGVGMDVVKKNIERLRGQVGIDSIAGVGTELVLRIPLTLAIVDGTTFTVGGVLYAIPLSDILEFHKPKSGQITQTSARAHVLRLRDELIPIVELYDFFRAKTERTEITDGMIIVVQAHGRKAGLLVDQISGYHQIVVKALPEYLGDMRAISGCSVMGNGDVNLIIDTGSLLREELD